MSTLSTDNRDQSDSIGARIREERKRLGKSQAVFAEMVGIHRRTQVNYESGERQPDTNYLAAASKAGADVGYVLTGEFETSKRQTYVSALGIIRAELELYKGFEEEWTAALSLVEADWKDWFAEPSHGSMSRGNAAILALLKKSPVLMLDTRQLEDVIEKLEFVLDATGEQLSPSGKAQAMLCLFREAKKSGARLDFKSVEAVIMACR